MKKYNQDKSYEVSWISTRWAHPRYMLTLKKVWIPSFVMIIRFIITFFRYAITYPIDEGLTILTIDDKSDGR